jgi:glycosyltransferase involved in cell wall biosynthesis
MRILCCFDGSGPKAHRILYPCSGLEKYGYEIKVVRYPQEEELAETDILFFNRAVQGIYPEKLLEFKNKYGFNMVCDLDDHWTLDKGHPLYEGYQAHNISGKIEWFIKNSDLVFVTHDRLADEVIPLNKNVHILPNAIPKEHQFLVKKIPDEAVRLFWAGGITHKRDLELLRKPLKLIKRDGVKFIMGGYEEKEPEWKQMAKIFTCDSTHNTMVIKSEPVHNYYHVYALCDISLIPLIDVSFNRYKSNLKILEAANIEAPVVVSRVHPYLDFPEHLVNYIDTYHTWYSQINKLIKDPILRKEQGIELRNYCDVHFDFEKINLVRKQIFDEAIKPRHTGNKVQAEAESLDQ